MTRARQNANVTAAVGRNMIINGSMNVAQRSASVTGLGAASGYFTCDRWQIETGSSAGRFTMTQTADGPNGISANCIKLDCTTADTSIAASEHLILEQRLEGQNVQRIGKGVAGAKQITVSFYVKASASFTFGCELVDLDNSRQCAKLFSTTTDWVRHELTFPADVDDGSSPFDDDNAGSLALFFWLHAGTTFTGGTLNTAAFANNTNANRAAGIDSFYSNTANNFFITGVQMEIGPVATDFEQEQISVTQNKCQRYFQKFGSENAFDFMNGFGIASSSTVLQSPTYLKTNMRSTPAVSFSAIAVADTVNSTTAITAAAVSNTVNNSKIALIEYTVGSTALTQYRSYYVRANNNAAAHVSFDAEL